MGSRQNHEKNIFFPTYTPYHIIISYIYIKYRKISCPTDPRQKNISRTHSNPVKLPNSMFSWDRDNFPHQTPFSDPQLLTPSLKRNILTPIHPIRMKISTHIVRDKGFQTNPELRYSDQ